MAIEILDAVTSVSGGADRYTVTWQHTVSGTQRVLLVGLALTASPVVSTHSTVTFHGVSMDPVGAVQLFTSNLRGLELFSLVNPDVGTWDIVATAESVGYTSIAGGAISLTGVDQSTPLGTPNAAVVTSGNLETTVTSATGELVVDVAACHWGTSSLISADASQSQELETYFASTSDGDQTRRRVGMSTKAGAASVTMLWTGQNGDGSAIIAVPVKPAAASSVTWLRHRA